MRFPFFQRRHGRPRLFSRRPEIDRSLRHSVKDGVAYSVMTGAGETYFSAFAVLLKATPGQIGLLAALPQLMASVAQLLSAWMGHRLQRRMPIILLGAGVQWFSWWPLVLLPLLFPEQGVWLMIGAVMLYYFGSNLAVPQWSSLMGDLVHKRRRGRYFALRTRLASITSFVAMLAAGVLLHLFDERGYALAGFVTVFAIAMLGRVVSIHHLRKMHDPPGQTAALEIPSFRLWKTHIAKSPFAFFSLYFALMQCATAIASPFFAVYMLRDLQFSYLEFTQNAAMVILAQFLTLNAWGRIADIFGNRLILVLTGALIPLLPVLWTVSTEHWYLMVLQACGGLLWAGFSLSAGNFIYDALPANKRVTLMALHNTLANVGIFIGALLGGYLATHLDKTFSLGGRAFDVFSVFYIIFVLSSLARGMVAIIFLPRIKEVRYVKAVPVRELVFRVSRFNAVWGFLFDVVGSRKKPGNPPRP